MDPITGVGQIASVVQLVTFGIDCVKICRDLYEQGSVREYRGLEYTTSHLTRLTDKVQQGLQDSIQISSAITREEKDLLDLALKCGECAHKLQHELLKLQRQPSSSAVVVAKKAARAI